MSPEVPRLDRELGELLRLHRVGKGMSVETLAREADLTEPVIADAETGIATLTLAQYWTVAHCLDQDPVQLLEQANDRLSLPEAPGAEASLARFEFIGSVRGRQILGALAACDRPDVLDALADMILAVGLRTYDGRRRVLPLDASRRQKAGEPAAN